MARRREAEIQAGIRDWWLLQGYVRNISTTAIPDGKGGFRTNPSRGVSDLVGVIRRPCASCGESVGRFLAVEVKAPGGRLRPDQATYLDQVRAAGGLATMARSVADVEDALEEQLAQERSEADHGPLRRTLARLLNRLDLTVAMSAEISEPVKSKLEADLVRLRKTLDL